MEGQEEKVGLKGQNMDQGIELLKIQVCSERAHAKYTTVVTTSFAIFIGFLVVLYTLLFQNVTPLYGFIVGVTTLTICTMYELYRVRRGFRKDIKKISDMIEAVKKGKQLPKLEQLLK